MTQLAGGYITNGGQVLVVAASFPKQIQTQTQIYIPAILCILKLQAGSGDT